ncbi:hypothetical protein CHS0354_029720 [Potamilus streckersoni]|uniref:Uncharacterized protein n=1 Tax=Potamilus streckersoni TaxID=2493646 RepID=A0AAE0RTK9_9BIVA|nr:hypothetical protein CHS0354_029720 [Potamilus streckersoni]
MFHHLSGFSTFEFLLNLFQVISPELEKQETPCIVNSATSLDMAPTEEAFIFTQILHDERKDLDNQKSGLDFVLSTQSEADRLGRKEAVRTVRMTKTLQCHIVNNISTAYQFPYIEDDLIHTVKAVLQGRLMNCWKSMKPKRLRLWLKKHSSQRSNFIWRSFDNRDGNTRVKLL